MLAWTTFWTNNWVASGLPNTHVMSLQCKISNPYFIVFCSDIGITCSHWLLGLKRYAQPTIRYAIRCTQYDTFRDTFAILTREAEAWDPGLRSEALHSTDYNCLRSNDAQWLQQWRPPRSFQMQCVCDEFTHFIGIYWLFSVVSRVRLACVTSVPYRIVSSSEHIAICTIAFVSAIYRCAGVSFQPYWLSNKMYAF